VPKWLLKRLGRCFFTPGRGILEHGTRAGLQREMVRDCLPKKARLPSCWKKTGELLEHRPAPTREINLVSHTKLCLVLHARGFPEFGQLSTPWLEGISSGARSEGSSTGGCYRNQDPARAVSWRLATEGSMEISLVMGKQRGKQAELHYGADEPSCIFWYYYK
jgi:hypothetical protein